MVVTRSGMSTEVPRNRDTDVIRKVRARKTRNRLSQTQVYLPLRASARDATHGTSVVVCPGQRECHRDTHRRAHSTGICLSLGPKVVGEVPPQRDGGPPGKVPSTKIGLLEGLHHRSVPRVALNDYANLNEVLMLSGDSAASGVKLPQPIDVMDDINDDPGKQGAQYEVTHMLENTRPSTEGSLTVGLGLPEGSREWLRCLMYTARSAAPSGTARVVTTSTTASYGEDGSGGSHGCSSRVGSASTSRPLETQGTPLYSFEEDTSACIDPLIVTTGRWARSHRSRVRSDGHGQYPRAHQEFGCVPAKFPNSLGPLRCILDQAREGSPSRNGLPLDAICEGDTPTGRSVRVWMQGSYPASARGTDPRSSLIDGDHWSARPCLVKPADDACGRSLIESDDKVPNLMSLCDEQANGVRRIVGPVSRLKLKGLKSYCSPTVSEKLERGCSGTVEVEDRSHACQQRSLSEDMRQLGKPPLGEGLSLGVLSEGRHYGMEPMVRSPSLGRSLKFQGPTEPHPMIWCHDRSCLTCCRDGGIVYYPERYGYYSHPPDGCLGTEVCDLEVIGLRVCRTPVNTDTPSYGMGHGAKDDYGDVYEVTQGTIENCYPVLSTVSTRPLLCHTVTKGQGGSSSSSSNSTTFLQVENPDKNGQVPDSNKRSSASSSKLRSERTVGEGTPQQITAGDKDGKVPPKSFESPATIPLGDAQGDGKLITHQGVDIEPSSEDSKDVIEGQRGQHGFHNYDGRRSKDLESKGDGDDTNERLRSRRSTTSRRGSGEGGRGYDPYGGSSGSDSDTPRSNRHRGRSYSRRGPPSDDSSSSDSSRTPRTRRRSSRRRSARSSSSNSDYSAKGVRYRLTGGGHFQPARRVVRSSRKCDVCATRDCRTKVHHKEFDSAEQMALKLRPSRRYGGGDDIRSGTTWIDEMERTTEGHSEVVQYLWLKHHTDTDVWDKVTDKDPPPHRCYRSYAYHLERICKRFRRLYDTDEHLQRANKAFQTCVQGQDSVHRFVKRLERLSTELYHLGAPPLEYMLKWKLFTGLTDKDLRSKMDDYVSDPKVTYQHFRDKVLAKHRRMYQMAKMMEDGNYVTGSGYESGERRRYKDYKKDFNKDKRGSRFVQALLYDSNSDSSDKAGERCHIYAIGQDKTEFKCYRCLGKGHSAKRCTAEEPKDMDQRCTRCGSPAHMLDDCKVQVERATCARCGLTGHLAYICRGSIDAKGPSRSPSPMRSSSRQGAKVHCATYSPFRIFTVSHGTPMEAEKIYRLNIAREERTPMVIGEVKVEGRKIKALFDTGAELSLVTLSTLRELGMDGAVDSTVTPSISVADGGSLDIYGAVHLEITTPNISIKDQFIVTDDCLTVPLLLGCPTLAKMHTSIHFTPNGTHIYTKDISQARDDDKRRVRFCDKVEYLAKEPLQGWEHPTNEIMVNYQVHVINEMAKDARAQDFGEHLLTVEKFEDPESPWYWARFPTQEPLEVNGVMTDKVVVGRQGDEPSDRDSTTESTVMGSKTPGSQQGEICSTPTPTEEDPQQADQRGQRPLLQHGLEQRSSMELDDELYGTEGTLIDDKPPWEVLQRQWSYDGKAVLGRPILSVPWITDERPKMNYRQAAERGARSFERLNDVQKASFDKALQQYLDRGFCGIVKDNRVEQFRKVPTATECQKVWELLVKDSALEGSVVTLPRHFTPAHPVFRDNHVTTPCRLVLDFRELNKFCYKGGRSQNNLLGALLHVRGFRHLIGSDVSKAFCQMVACLRDIPYTSYTCIGPYTVLWERISFGSTTAPSMLEACSYDITDEIARLIEAAPEGSEGLVQAKLLDRGKVRAALLFPTDEGVQYILQGPPVPTRVIFEKFVDDLFFGGETADEAQACRDFVSHIFKGHGLVTDPLKDLKACYGGCDKPEVQEGHVLGYTLTLDKDEMKCAFSGYMPADRCDKRGACAILSSLYDPMGLLLEMDLAGRLLWRDICVACKDWSTLLAKELVERLRQWVLQVKEVVDKVRTQRFVDLNKESLLVSTDASIDAWGVDIRCTGDYIPVRVMARGGLFPGTQASWSIPRKELVGVYQGLRLVKAASSYLPVTTSLQPLQAPLQDLTPRYKARPFVLLCDSEITIYRLRKESNDKRLPAPERRRLAQIREMCEELDCVIRHVPSELNYADSITRARLDFGRTISAKDVEGCLRSDRVVYDYKERLDSDKDEDGVEEDNKSPKVMAVNIDGIDLPPLEGHNGEELAELKALERYAAVDGRYGEGILHDEEFEECVMVCVRRCQLVDDDLKQFRLFLSGDITKSQLGMKAKVLERLGRICYLDQDGLIHRKPDSSEESEREVATGVLYLGESGYSECMVRLLAAIYHYIYGHLGIPRVHVKMKLRYSRKGMKRLVRSTLRSCVPCLKARAARSLDYMVIHVQKLLTKGLWQVVGADLAGPYGRSANSGGDGQGDDDEHFLLLVHDHVSGFTCARPLKDSKPKTIAKVFHSIFCEHGAPRVLITDRDMVHLMRKDVKVVLAKHGVRYYTLPGYAQFLSFWERPHKDFVEVTRALRVSMDRSADTSYVEDYQLAVRAYNVTPRMWANVSPAELHFTYGVRIPGERGDGDGDIDWDELKVKYFDTDLLSFMKDSLPMMDSLKEDHEVTLREYLELWRMRQERNLERMAVTDDRRYEPQLYDLVFTSKAPSNRIGHHLDVIWSGPSTITSLKGSAIVGVTPGIILEGVGNIHVSEDGKHLEVPDEYGNSEDFPLKNVKHAAALQGVVYGYLQEGKRVFLDSEGAIRDTTIRPGEEQDDIRMLVRARKKVELEKIVKESRRSRTTSNDAIGPLPPDVLPSEEGACHPDGDLLPPDVQSEEASEEGDSSEDDDQPLVDQVDISRLREHLGVGEGFEFGRFMKGSPHTGMVVVSADPIYAGLAIVLEGDEGVEDGSVLLQPVKVEWFGGCIELRKVREVDLVTVQSDSLVFVSPCEKKWTRKRSKDLMQLLQDVQGTCLTVV